MGQPEVKIPQWIKFSFMTSVVLYVVSLFSSMAGMEIFSSLIILFALISFGYIWKDSKTVNEFWIHVRLGPDKAIGFYLVVVVIGLLINYGEKTDVVDGLGYARWILLLYALSFFFRRFYKPHFFKKGLVFFSVIMAIASVYSVIQFFWGIDLVRGPGEVVKPFGDYFRITGFFRIALTFTNVMGMAALLSLGFLIVNWKKFSSHEKMILGITTALGVSSVILGLSRAAWISISISILLLTFLQNRKWFVGAAVMILVVFTSLFLFNPSIQKKATDIFQSNNRSANLRLMIWQANFEIFKDHPVVGVGLHQNSNYLRDYYNRLGYHRSDHFISHAHNNLIHMLAGTGILGFLCYLVIILYFLWLSWYLWNNLPKEDYVSRSIVLGALSAQVYFHLGGMTECNFTDGEVNHMLMVIWSTLIAIKVNFKNQNIAGTT